MVHIHTCNTHTLTYPHVHSDINTLYEAQVLYTAQVAHPSGRATNNRHTQEQREHANSIKQNPHYRRTPFAPKETHDEHTKIDRERQKPTISHTGLDKETKTRKTATND